MKIAVVCSDVHHPIYPFLEEWSAKHEDRHSVQLARSPGALSGGDLLFLISCHEIVGRDVRGTFKATLVVHASDVPAGRGWSPHVWQILEGKTSIPITLLEASDEVDSGAIWAQEVVELKGHELAHEINRLLFTKELQLMDFAVTHHDKITPRPQKQAGASYYRRRSPDDSRLDPEKSIAEQFDLMRVSDPERYPAYFDIRGHRYFIRLSKEPLK